MKLRTPDNKAKNGGVLFFGKMPEQFLETAVIRCIKFDGVSKTHIVDDKIFGGPLMRQYQQSMQWLKEKLDIRYEIDGSGPRKEIWEIPETVFKEAIINSLSHRDYYDRGARITVELFSDRVEISNPGGLTSAISQAEFGTKSHSRNPLIFGLFVRIHMVEQVGSGIGRMKELMTEAGLSEPIFKTEGMFSTIFMRSQKSTEKNSEKGSDKMNDYLQQLEKEHQGQMDLLYKKFGEKFGESSEKIILMILHDKTVTTAEMAEIIKISARAVEKQLAKLKKEGIVERIGPNKGGSWNINL